MSATTRASLVPAPIASPTAARDGARQPAKRPSPYADWPLGKFLLAAAPMGLVHLAAFGVIFTGASAEVAWVAFALWLGRMVGITMGFHRYFSHRAFKTSRVFQFILALVSQSAGQRGVLWWASHHRRHHKYSDEPEDVHSPRQQGFIFAHIGWFYAPGAMDTDMERVKDLARFPELRLIDRYWYLPVVALGAIVTAIWGLEGFIVGFCLSTVVLWHTTFFVNSLAHVWGTRPYETSDDSRNNFVIALLTAGEGWHNNHHHYQSSARQGFVWWQVDLTYYVLKLLQLLRIVWDVREPPAHVKVAGYEKTD